MKTWILSAVCGLAVLTAGAVSTAEAGHRSVYRIRASRNYRAKMAKQVTRTARGTAKPAYSPAFDGIDGEHPFARPGRRARTVRIRANLLRWAALDGIDGERPLPVRGNR